MIMPFCPHASRDDDLLWRQSVAFQHPMVLTAREPLAGFKVENAMVSAMRYDGDGVFIRVYNGTDKEREASVFVDEGVRSFALTDGLMNPGEPEAVAGILRMTLPPYTVQGIKFYYGEGAR